MYPQHDPALTESAMPNIRIPIRIPESAQTPENLAALKLAIGYEETIIDREGNQVANPVTLRRAVGAYLSRHLNAKVHRQLRSAMPVTGEFSAEME